MDFSADPSRWQGYVTEQQARERFGSYFDEYWGRVSQAAQSVDGQILVDSRGQPIVAAYHAISAGKTEPAQNVWGNELPCLTAVDSAGDRHAPGYEKTTAIPIEQLRQKLEQDFPEDCVQEVLERVEELGLIDDADYALRCAKDLINIKHYSLQRVRQELRHRGIHDNDIEDAMQEFEDFDEQQAVQQLLEKKFAAALTEEKGRRRAFQALLRLGYDAGTVKSQMQRAMEQLEPEEEPEQPSDSEEEIRALLLKKYRKNLEDPKGIERAIRALMRRGYAYGDIRSVLKQLAEEE